MSPRARRVAWIAIVALGVALMVPSLFVGFLLDDYVYLTALSGQLPLRSSSEELFRFFSGDASKTSSLARLGYGPWWIDDDIRIAFFRPLSAALMRLEVGLFPGRAALHHLHSLAWWLALLTGAGLLMRRLFPGPVGWLAFLLFAVDESHVLPVAWISNRNALVALTPVVFGLLAHLAWRERRWRAGLPLSTAALAVGLLGGETALAGAAFLLAYEWLGATDSIRSRLLGLAPSGAVLLAYVVARETLGYGVSGSGIYVDPTVDPTAYAGLAAGRLPALAAAAISGLSADLWLLTPRLRPIQIGVGIAGSLALLAALRASASRLDPEPRRQLRWLLAGAALSLLPVAATFPSDRLLAAAALGYSPAIAIVLHGAWRSYRTYARRWVAAAGGAFAVMHLAAAPLLVLLVQAALIVQSRESVALARKLSTPGPPSRHAIVLYAPDHIVGIYLPLIALQLQRPLPASWRILSLARFDHRVTRTADRTLELEILDGTMMTGLFESLYRDDNHALVAGDRLDRGLLQVEILEDRGRRPVRVAFHFDRSLDDASLSLLAWIEGDLRPVSVPRIGESLTIPHTLGPAGF